MDRDRPAGIGRAMDKTSIVTGLLAHFRPRFNSENAFREFEQAAWVAILTDGSFSRWDPALGTRFIEKALHWAYAGYNRTETRRARRERRVGRKLAAIPETVRPEHLEATADLTLVARRHPEGFAYVIETGGEVTSETTFRRIPDHDTARAVRDLFAVERRIAAGTVYANDAIPRRRAYAPRHAA